MLKRIAIGLVLFLVVGYAVAAPYITAYRMKLAADAGDSERLSRFIDFEALRANLHPQVQDRVAAEAGRVSDDARIGAVLGVIAGGAVDSYVTPEGLATMLRTGGSGGDAEAEVSVGYRAWNRFAIETADMEMILTRAGLGWKLTEVNLR